MAFFCVFAALITRVVEALSPAASMCRWLERVGGGGGGGGGASSQNSWICIGAAKLHWRAYRLESEL